VGVESISKNVDIIVPCYNEEQNIDSFIHAILQLAIDVNFRIIFIDDGSLDNTWLKIQECMALSGIVPVSGIKLSRNFGKEAAIFAGLSSMKADACIIIDADLQHPPEKLSEMIAIWEYEQVDVVEGIKSHRGKENLIYKGFSKLFYSVMGEFQTQGASDFQLLDAKVVQQLIELPERQRFFRALSKWVGFNRKIVYYDVQARVHGQSNFNFWSSFKYAIKNITSFNAFPMQMVTILGLLFFMGSSILGGIALSQFLLGYAVEGFTTVILLLLIIGSVIMFSLGIIGYYIGKIYEEIKQRPIYIVQDRIDAQPTSRRCT